MANNHWLMNSEVLTLLRKLRKRLKAEFGITLQFADYGFEAQLARARDKTIDSETRQMISALEARRGAPFTTGEEAPPRLYRGHPILQEEPRKRDIYELIYGETMAEHCAAGQMGTTKKIYRGQRLGNH
ncbi:hypothetical protein [Microbulbifer thermotolerans]|nr:hypothetical protein [Microbulbifer thermotolerans]